MFLLRDNYFLLLILTFAAIIQFTDINKPFIGHHDYNSAWHGTAARNLERYGLVSTKFASVMNTDMLDKSKFDFYTHYPPLVPILIYPSFKLFGTRDWSLRLAPIIITLTTIFLIHKTASRFFSKQIGLVAAAISTVLPLVIYYGKIPTHDLFALPFVLLAINFYFDFISEKSKKNSTKLITTLILVHLTHWSGYYLTPLFTLHYLLFSKTRRKLLTSLMFPTLSLIMFLSHLLQTTWATASPVGGGLIDIFLGRLNLKDQPEGYSILNFFTTQSRYLVIYYTRPVLFFSALTSLLILVKIIRNKVDQKSSVLLILLIFGLAHGLIFRNISFIHDYIITSLWPFFALATSFGFFKFLEYLRVKTFLLQITITMVLLAAILIERAEFTRVLKATTHFKDGLYVGQIIASVTKSGQKSLILSPDFKNYYEVFTNYYADRLIDYEIPPKRQLEKAILDKKYKLIIAFPKRDTPPEYVILLENYSKPTKTNDLIIFKI